MALNTVGDLIGFCLRATGIAGTGQSALPEDFNDVLVMLRTMLGQWQVKRWLVPDDIDLAMVSTGAQSYSIGPSAPARIEAAFVRLLNAGIGQTFDYPPLYLIRSREEYNSISLKQMTSIPYAVFYDSAWPVGQLYFWPVPPAGQYELHVTLKGVLPTYAALTDPLNLPPQYQQALIYGLCLQVSMNYGLDPKPAHVAAYQAGLRAIRAANFQMRPLRMPGSLGRGYGYPSTGQLIGGAW